MSDARQVPILERFARLAAFYGAGRKLTTTGQPTLSDARRLVEELALPDRFEEHFRERTIRIRSAAELPELARTLAWALRAGVLRKSHGKLAATATWARSSHEERHRRAVQALVVAGPLQLDFPHSPSGYASLHAVVDERFPSLLMRLADGPLGLDDATEQLVSDVESSYQFFGPWAEHDELAGFCRARLVDTARLLELAALARLEPPGESSSGDSSPGGVASGGAAVGQAAAESGRWWHEPDPAPGTCLVPGPGARALIDRLELASRAPPTYRPGVAHSPTLHELRIALEEIEPPVWRQVVVPSGLSLAGLHEVLQAVMGWDDYHLHEFHIAGKRYGVDDGEDWDEPVLDDRRHRLDSLAVRGDSFHYLYDFGDHWLHRVEVLDVRSATAEEVPRLVGGERACPPEDCGGTGGYERLLASLADPDDEEHDSDRVWAGEDFDSERFDTAAARERLREVVGDRTPDLRPVRLHVVRDEV